MTTYFGKRGKANTEETASLSLSRAKEAGIKHIVVASNTGFAAKHFVNQGVHVVCVTHHVGFKEPGMDEMGPDMRKELKGAGVDILTTTHLFGNVERAITQKQGGLYPGGIISDTLRLFSQGVKVALEISTMALDAGLIPYGEPVIAVGGSGAGSDSAVVVIPSHAKTFFETQVLELICKPRNTRG